MQQQREPQQNWYSLELAPKTERGVEKQKCDIII